MPSRKDKRAVMYTDGACFGNPGPCGIGVYIIIGGDNIKISEHAGHGTNNYAEYSALIRGLGELRRMGVDSVMVKMDSELVVRQMTGVYKVKNLKLKPYHERAVALSKEFAAFDIEHVPREENQIADALSKDALKKKNIPGAGTSDPNKTGGSPDHDNTPRQGGLPF